MARGKNRKNIASLFSKRLFFAVLFLVAAGGAYLYFPEAKYSADVVTSIPSGKCEQVSHSNKNYRILVTDQNSKPLSGKNVYLSSKMIASSNGGQWVSLSSGSTILSTGVTTGSDGKAELKIPLCVIDKSSDLKYFLGKNETIYKDFTIFVDGVQKQTIANNKFSSGFSQDEIKAFLTETENSYITIKTSGTTIGAVVSDGSGSAVDASFSATSQANSLTKLTDMRREQVIRLFDRKTKESLSDYKIKVSLNGKKCGAAVAGKTGGGCSNAPGKSYNLTSNGLGEIQMRFNIVTQNTVKNSKTSISYFVSDSSDTDFLIKNMKVYDSNGKLLKSISIGFPFATNEINAKKRLINGGAELKLYINRNSVGSSSTGSKTSEKNKNNFINSLLSKLKLF